MEQAGRERLKAACAGRVLFDEPLARHTSMGVGGPADVIVFPADLDDLVRCLRFLNEAGLPVTPVGNGTNLICRDGGVRGAIVVLKDLQDLRIDRETGEHPPVSGTCPGPPGIKILPRRESGDPEGATDSGRRGDGEAMQGADGAARRSVEVTAGAGVALQALVALALKEALAGAEFLAGIPGSVGGAVRMNAGAYGRELSDILTAVVWLTRTGELRETPREALTFSYRRTDLPAEAVIAAARFALHPGEAGAIRRAVDETLALRRAKHPLAQRNAGSIFKNPRPTPAGRLIEAAGLKGTRVGQAMVSEMHANFIVNLGGATAADVIALMDLIRTRVRAHAGVDLEPEVRIIGET
jgi:UDP-N-acetylmuramate dehydrogenase